MGNLGRHPAYSPLPVRAEWNDRFRDTARTLPGEDVDGGLRFRASLCREMSTRLCGSGRSVRATEPGRGAPASINFVSCHDGFIAENPHRIPLQATMKPTAKT